jgi:hypothetical protein
MLAMLAVVLRIAVDLREIRDALRIRLEDRPDIRPHHFPHAKIKVQSGCSAVWEWRDCRWRLISTNVPEGTDVGPPPSYPGAFDGETVKTWVPNRRS